MHSVFSLGCCDITCSIHSRNVPIDLGRFLYIGIIKPNSTRLGQHTWVTRISLCMYLAIYVLPKVLIRLVFFFSFYKSTEYNTTLTIQ